MTIDQGVKAESERGFRIEVEHTTVRVSLKTCGAAVKGRHCRDCMRGAKCRPWRKANGTSFEAIAGQGGCVMAGVTKWLFVNLAVYRLNVDDVLGGLDLCQPIIGKVYRAALCQLLRESD